MGPKQADSWELGVTFCPHIHVYKWRDSVLSSVSPASSGKAENTGDMGLIYPLATIGQKRGAAPDPSDLRCCYVLELSLIPSCQFSTLLLQIQGLIK